MATLPDGSEVGYTHQLSEMASFNGKFKQNLNSYKFNVKHIFIFGKRQLVM